MLSIQSRFQRISLSMSGVLLFPVSGIFSLVLAMRCPNISHVQSSVPVEMPEFTT